ILEAPDDPRALERDLLDHAQRAANVGVLHVREQELGARQDAGEGIVEIVSDLAGHLAEGAKALLLDDAEMAGDQVVQERAKLAQGGVLIADGRHCGTTLSRLRTEARGDRERTGSTWTVPGTCGRPGSRGPSSRPAASRPTRRPRSARSSAARSRPEGSRSPRGGARLHAACSRRGRAAAAARPGRARAAPARRRARAEPNPPRSGGARCPP